MDVPLTIPALFEGAVERSPQAPWLFHEDDAWTYEEAAACVGGMAAALRELGVGRGTRVLATMRNSAECLFAWLAAMRLGAIMLPVNPASTPNELEGFVRQYDPELAIGDEPLGAVRTVAAAALHSDG